VRWSFFDFCWRLEMRAEAVTRPHSSQIVYGRLPSPAFHFEGLTGGNVSIIGGVTELVEGSLRIAPVLRANRKRSRPDGSSQVCRPTTNNRSRHFGATSVLRPSDLFLDPARRLNRLESSLQFPRHKQARQNKTNKQIKPRQNPRTVGRNRQLNSRPLQAVYRV